MRFLEVVTFSNSRQSLAQDSRLEYYVAFVYFCVNSDISLVSIVGASTSLYYIHTSSKK